MLNYKDIQNNNRYAHRGQSYRIIFIIENKRTYHRESTMSKTGRHVGIISHVEELQERIPVQIQVIQEGNNSSSKVKIVP